MVVELIFLNNNYCWPTLRRAIFPRCAKPLVFDQENDDFASCCRKTITSQIGPLFVVTLSGQTFNCANPSKIIQFALFFGTLLL